jgi:hypothetical protein
MLLIFQDISFLAMSSGLPFYMIYFLDLVIAE